MSLLKQCLDLHHHSLQNFIMQQSQNQQAYTLYEINSHPQIDTISQKIQQILKIYTAQTYQSAKQKQYTKILNQKQLKMLKKLSILAIFEGKQNISITSICTQLDLSKIQLYKILTEMSSKDLINIKIDDRNNRCQVLSTTNRYIPGFHKNKVSIECLNRLKKISLANKELINLLVNSGK